MAHITLHPKRERRLATGHRWIFSNEIFEVKGEPPVGGRVQVRRTDGHHLAWAWYHPHSLIAARIISYEREEPGPAFFEDRLREAWSLRERVYPGADSFRWVHSESDGLPGVVIDKLASAVVVQIVSAGAEAELEALVAAIRTVANPDTIVLRNDSGLRTLEQLPLYVRTAHGAEAPEPVEIQLEGLRYMVPLMDGQKTGFYLDQRWNRSTFERFVRPGDRVLDAFCSDGGFALHAARAGARVLAVDSSKAALERGKANAALNGLGGITWNAHDVMDWLPELVGKDSFDVVNLDPPSFAKNKKSAGAALKGYRKLHEAALAVLKPGGILCTSKCSHHIEAGRFFETLDEAVFRAGRRYQVLHEAAQPPDHPVHPAMPETDYLAMRIVRVS